MFGLWVVQRRAVQKIVHIVQILQGFTEAGMEFFCGGLRCIPDEPALQTTGILQQLLPDGGRTARRDPHRAVRTGNAEIFCQLFHRLTGRKLKKSADKINDISVGLTSETVEPAVHLHAGVLVRMEGTADHAVPGHGEAVQLRRLPGRDGVFYVRKDRGVTLRPNGWGTGERTKPGEGRG